MVRFNLRIMWGFPFVGFKVLLVFDSFIVHCCFFIQIHINIYIIIVSVLRGIIVLPIFDNDKLITCIGIVQAFPKV